MATSNEPRVGIYIDFDNIVISRYDQLHGRGNFLKNHIRTFRVSSEPTGEMAQSISAATIDLGAILDFASSFGTIAVSRAYADWSIPVNSDYRQQLIKRAVDLVQLFPVVASMKNGADIRLAVDVVEDLFRLPDLTHVVIVAGDSDYIALAQRCKVLGRHVVGIGVAGATSRALAAACDEFADYDALPGVKPAAARARKAKTVVEPSKPEKQEPDQKEPEPAKPPKKRPSKKSSPPKTPQDEAADLLVRALELSTAKNDEEWQPSSAVKNQMLRMDPTFQERALGFSSFTGFVKSLETLVELDEDHPARRIRLVPA
ncbi:Uncharacterized conserved protein, LabA/DUF88 family [Paramicrobacterium humi]|uniref:Uncharacterized conserved protein, LabA/DUF88 family n=1 Tax=Paramicrobacterium humi TaxID=640635 RepID=A0A1H4JII1_9MICO|nr:NYN domain-containing protein [Microbacterium humi]SEB45845.1 Uncharacterized conserved protein, LabA/DUF88 family [Microbacterium humi]